MNLNRAVNEDVVCVEVLPEKDWTCPSSIVIDEDIKEDEAEENTAKQVCWNSFELLCNRKHQITNVISLRSAWVSATGLKARFNCVADEEKFQNWLSCMYLDKLTNQM